MKDMLFGWITKPQFMLTPLDVVFATLEIVNTILIIAVIVGLIIYKR